jgi:hypothetical protein
MEERPMSTDDMLEKAPIVTTGTGFVIRVAAESSRHHDWDLIGPTGAWLLGGRARESHAEALEDAYRLQAVVYPDAAVEVTSPDES